MAYHGKYHGYRGSRSRHSRSSQVGLERALEHIREAEELSRQLGGTDKDVKRYFFSLPPSELKSVFDEYGRRYGRVKQDYAEQTFHRWRSGSVHMSGLVAGRLFNLLPPRMPLEHKYALVENLWKEYCPTSHKILKAGPDAHHEEIIDTIRSHLLSVVVHYKIPELLENRFNWLAAGDVNVKQQLLNHFLERERDLIVHAIRERMPVFLKHLNAGEKITHKMQQVIDIGKHKLELHFEPKCSGISLLDAHEVHWPKPSDSSVKWGCLIWIILGLLVLIVRALLR